MKIAPLISATLLACLASSPAVEHVTVIGDSLTKEYQVTFAGVHVPLLGLNIDGIDETNLAARNWIEILHERRNAHFDLGVFKNSLAGPYSDTRLLGHEYNWAVPGATARLMRILLTNPQSPELMDDPDVGLLISLASDYEDVPELITFQVQNTSSAAVIWFGGNDLRFGNSDPSTTVDNVRIKYQTMYQGDGTGAGNPQPLMNSIRDSVKTIAQFVRTANPNIPIVVVAVPHIGCAPDVKASFPTDPVRTQRITTAIQGLNNELKTWTETTLGGAFVDIFPLTTELLPSGSPDIGGITIANTSDTQPANASAAAHNRFVFSHDGFHPITTFQGRVAQAIQAKMREKWPVVFGASPPLTDRDLVTTILGIPARTGFDEFMAASGAPAGLRGENADADGDGVSNLVEFALAGNNPWSNASPALPLPALESTPVPSLSFTWMPAYKSNIFANIVCEQSANLSTWTGVPAAQITTNLNGTVTARVPQAGGKAFMRLNVTPTP